MPHVGYHTKFGRYICKTDAVGVRIWGPKIWVRFGALRPRMVCVAI